jgi:hypothetical protein
MVALPRFQFDGRVETRAHARTYEMRRLTRLTDAVHPNYN